MHKQSAASRTLGWWLRAESEFVWSLLETKSIWQIFGQNSFQQVLYSIPDYAGRCDELIVVVRSTSGKLMGGSCEYFVGRAEREQQCCEKGRSRQTGDRHPHTTWCRIIILDFYDREETTGRHTLLVREIYMW